MPPRDSEHAELREAHNLFTSLEKIPWGELYGQSSHTCSENSISVLAYTSSFTPSMPTTTTITLTLKSVCAFLPQDMDVEINLWEVRAQHGVVF